MLEQSTQKVKEYFLYGVIIVLLLGIIGGGIAYFIQERNLNKVQNSLVDKEYQDSMKFKMVKSKDGSTITTQNQLLANSNDATVKSLEKQSGTIDLQSQVKIVTKIVIIHDTISLPEKLISVKDTQNGTIDSFNCLPLPAQFTKIDSSIQMDEEVTSDGLVINYLKIPNTTTVTIADQKKGLFNTTPVVIVKNSNKYLSVVDEKNIVLKQDKTKKWKILGIGGVGGFVIGVVISSLLTSHIK